MADEVDERLDRLAALIASSPHNLVGARDREHVRERHIDEAAALLPLLHLRQGERWLDLGTGGGLPGLVLAILRPATSWTLLDATRKKVEEVERFIDELHVPDARAVWGRAEDLAHTEEHRGVYDGVISRAVGPLPVVMELARGFLHDGGRLAAIKGPGVKDELDQAKAARKALRLHAINSRPVRDPGRSTVVVTMRAQGPPPARYPRRVGEPAAAPLGGRSR